MEVSIGSLRTSRSIVRNYLVLAVVRRNREQRGVSNLQHLFKGGWNFFSVSYCLFNFHMSSIYDVVRESFSPHWSKQTTLSAPSDSLPNRSISISKILVITLNIPNSSSGPRVASQMTFCTQLIPLPSELSQNVATPLVDFRLIDT